MRHLFPIIFRKTPRSVTRLPVVMSSTWLDTVKGGFYFVYLMALGHVVSFAVTYYLIFYTKLIGLVLLYLIWTITLDKDTHERGGRRLEWMRNWKGFTYIQKYFPLKIHKATNAEFHREKNYLLACFPHGVIPAGPVFPIVSNRLGFQELFPNHVPYMGTLRLQFWTPFQRELLLSLGAVSVSSNSLDYVLSKKDGGNMFSIMVGGAEEAVYSNPGVYKVVLKNRKGFVKIAMKHGASLVPVISFGDCDTYAQFDNPPGSLLRKYQNWFKQKTGISPVFVKGHPWCPIAPRRVPINTVGK